MALLVVLTGASGSGKTTIAEAFARDHGRAVDVLRFDSIGVPATEEMIRDHGSPENWQRDMMIVWAERIAPVVAGGRPVLLEGQVRPSFIQSALASAGIGNFRIVLVDCSDEVRSQRLCGPRAQPELADTNMMNWAAFLRREGQQAETLDTGRLSVSDAVSRLAQLFAMEANAKEV